MRAVMLAAVAVLGCGAPPVETCATEGAVFPELALGTEECAEWSRAWDLAAAEFAPRGRWRVSFRPRVWVGLDWSWWSSETWPNGVVIVAENPYAPGAVDPEWFASLPLRRRVCSTGLIHEVAHAGEIWSDTAHATWGDPKDPASKYARVERVREECNR